MSDSFWILLEYLNPGKHTISFSGAINLDNIPPLMGLYEAGATYNLDVIPKYYWPHLRHKNRNLEIVISKTIYFLFDIKLSF